MSLVCLVTGSSRGIGLEIARDLAAQGHQVVLNSRSGISQEVLDTFKDYSLPVFEVTGDVSQFDQAEAMVQAVIDQFGQLDVLVNNAGITRDGLAMRMSEEDFDVVMDINLKGTFNMARHAIKPMLKQRSGTIINLSSVSGLMGNAGQANYAASKAGVIGLTKSLARELGGRSITVNAIAPGFIETDMTDVLSDKVKKAVIDQIPLRRFGQVSDIAKTVNFLIDNRYITGQTLVVDGGMTMM